MSNIPETHFREQIGTQANIHLYDRSLPTPLNFILNNLTAHLGENFGVYWVEDGPAEILDHSANDKAFVAYSIRNLSLTGHLRNLFVAEHVFNTRVEFAARAALQLIGELALRSGNPDFAALAFARAIVGRKKEMAWGMDDKAHMMALERQPINEAYMSVWFYGLLQAFGKYSPMQAQSFEQGSGLSNAGLLKNLAGALNELGYDGSLNQKIIATAHDNSSDSLIHFDRLRKAALSDIFANSVLMSNTVDIMKQVGKQEFNMLQFIQEAIMAHQVVAFVEECQGLAAYSKIKTPSETQKMESILHPAVVKTRYLILKDFLLFNVTQFLYGKEHKPEEKTAVDTAIQKAMQHFSPRFNAAIAGINTAREFVIHPSVRPDSKQVIEQLKQQLTPENEVDRQAISSFCKTAEGLGKDSPLNKELKALI